MPEIECTTRKWGSSIGIIIPKEVVDTEQIKPNEQIRVTFRRIPLAKALWGLVAIKDTRDTQEIKDELRKGWGSKW